MLSFKPVAGKGWRRFELEAQQSNKRGKKIFFSLRKV